MKNPGTSSRDPRFVDAARRGAGPRTALAFQLDKGSPALDAGVPVPAGIFRPARRDYFGDRISHRRAIGFSER